MRSISDASIASVSSPEVKEVVSRARLGESSKEFIEYHSIAGRPSPSDPPGMGEKYAFYFARSMVMSCSRLNFFFLFLWYVRRKLAVSMTTPSPIPLTCVLTILRVSIFAPSVIPMIEEKCCTCTYILKSAPTNPAFTIVSRRPVVHWLHW